MTRADSITRCRACYNSGLEAVFEMDAMPLAGGFAATRLESLEAERYPLTWVQCARCRLVQVLEDVNDAVLFNTYRYESSHIPTLVAHFQAFADVLASTYPAGTRVLEVGCNDGVLLARLPGTWDRVGVDPSDVAVKAAVDAQYTLFPAPFTPDLGLTGFDVVVASNCMAHMSDIGEAFAAASAALRPGGTLWVEVHDLIATLERSQWDTVYHEHRAEYSIFSLVAVARLYGLRVRSVYSLPLHGGLLRVSFTPGADNEESPLLRVPVSFDALREAYRTRRDSAVYATLAHASAREELSAYGASGRATVWFNQLPELRYRCVYDDSPARQGRWVPGVGIPIREWDEQPTQTCLITAWNYADAVKAAHPDVKRWVQAW